MIKHHAFTLSASVLMAAAAASAPLERGTPSSLLLFPEYDTNPGMLSLITVTNTQLNSANGGVLTRWVYVDGDSCTELDRYELLTPGDTITVVASAHNPQPGAGYLFVYAVDPLSLEPITHNYLIGHAATLDGVALRSYSAEPQSFLGIFSGDLDGDGRRDLDGNEYDSPADEILVPRFMGQNAAFQSKLVLIDLTGGAGAATTIDMLIYNDNEEVFSAEHAFSCWERVSLLDITGLFGNNFLVTTNHDLSEVAGLPNQESGWFRIHGNRTETPSVTVYDPAIVAMLIDNGPSGSAGLPLSGIGYNENGSLVPQLDFFLDCNENGVPDDQDIAKGFSPDCDANGVPDECDPDCDGDGIPDACEVDCNGNGIPDECEKIEDCNGNGIPDECEPDCDADGVPDSCEPDCNANGIPDDCEALADCNENSVPDECEDFADCNGNGVPDECDFDADGNGVPDDCDLDCSNNVVVELWPPNHQYESVDLAALIDALPNSGSSADIVITSITQDEPLDAGGGGPNAADCDGYGVGTSVATLRSERLGNGNGRVYVVGFTATGPSGLTCSGSILVTVPHSQNGVPAVDDGQLYDSTQNCP